MPRRTVTRNGNVRSEIERVDESIRDLVKKHGDDSPWPPMSNPDEELKRISEKRYARGRKPSTGTKRDRGLALEAWRKAFKSFKVGPSLKAKGMGLFARRRLKTGRVELWGFPVRLRRRRKDKQKTSAHGAPFQFGESVPVQHRERPIAGPMAFLNAACSKHAHATFGNYATKAKPGQERNIWKTMVLKKGVQEGEEVFARYRSDSGSDWVCGKPECQSRV